MELLLYALFVCLIAVLLCLLLDILISMYKKVKINGIRVIMGMEDIVDYIVTCGFHASPFLIKKWIKNMNLPVRYELDRYYATSKCIDHWLRKNRKHIEKL